LKIFFETIFGSRAASARCAERIAVLAARSIFRRHGATRCRKCLFFSGKMRFLRNRIGSARQAARTLTSQSAVRPIAEDAPGQSLATMRTARKAT
jgi:hypothetical protein